jgi:hypothetical protein
MQEYDHDPSGWGPWKGNSLPKRSARRGVPPYEDESDDERRPKEDCGNREVSPGQGERRHAHQRKPPRSRGQTLPSARVERRAEARTFSPREAPTEGGQKERERREQNRIGDESDAWEEKQTNGRRQLGDKHTERKRARESRAPQGPFDECS